MPIPVFTDRETLARDLAEIERADRQRPHYAKGVSIEELWHQEAQKLLALPDKPYEVFRLDNAKVNAYGEIRFDQASFFLPGGQPDAEVLLKVFWEQSEVFDRDYQKLAQFPWPYTNKTMDIPWREVVQSLQKKPRSVNHSQFVRRLPTVIQQFVLAQDTGAAPGEIKLRLSWLSEWLASYQLDEIARALKKEWSDTANPHAFYDRMKHRLNAIRNPQKTLAEVLPTATELPAIPPYAPDLNRYDLFAPKAGR